MIRTPVANPLVKIGWYVLNALAGKSELSELTETEMDTAADYITDKYTTPGAWRNFLAGVIFPNSGFAQYSYDKPHLEHKKREYAEAVLRRYRSDVPILPGQHCVFCGRDAVFTATREHIPLLNAQGYGNFGSLGQAGLPVCGVCLLAAHALPLGCIIVSGRLLAIYSDDDQITYNFAVSALAQMRTLLQMDSLEKLPGKRFAHTRMIEALREVQRRGHRLLSVRSVNASLTGYLFTNSGQNAEIEIFELPSDVMHFLIQLQQQRDETIKQDWERVVARGWVESKNHEEDGGNANRKNQLYEDLFTLPDQAFAFLRRHILPVKSWALARFFMEKVMHMDQKTIDLLYELGTRFAAYSNEKSGFLFDFMRESNYTKWRQKLVEASYDSTRKYGKPLVTSAEFIRMFTKPHDADKWWSWKLPRDIVTLCILEHKGETGEALPETDVIFDESSAEDEA